MLRLLVILIAVVSLAACVGDSSSTPDGGGDASTDAGNNDAKAGPCTFGTSHFGDGCKFGP